MILPLLAYFSDSFSWSPRKSEKRRITPNSQFLNGFMFVRVNTRYAKKLKFTSVIFLSDWPKENLSRYKNPTELTHEELK